MFAGTKNYRHEKSILPMILLLTSSLQLFSQLNPSLDFEQWNSKTKLVPHEPMSRFDRQYELTNDPHHGKLALSFINGVYYGESPSVLPRKEDSVKNRINFRPFSFDFWVKHATDSPDVKTVAIIYLMKDTRNRVFKAIINFPG